MAAYRDKEVGIVEYGRVVHEYEAELTRMQNVFSLDDVDTLSDLVGNLDDMRGIIS